MTSSVPPPPPALNSYIYTRDFNEVKHFGKLNSTVRTADQTAYANFWYELSDIGWNRIATDTGNELITQVCTRLPVCLRF